MLDQILKTKQKEIQLLMEQSENKTHAVLTKRPSLIHALSNKGFQVIAEIKRKSPSSGHLAAISDPLGLAKLYEKGGATGISVLTDKEYFNGSLDDLIEVAKVVTIPILRKDFIIHPIQIKQTVGSGASAILLIVAALGSQTKEMLKIAQEHGLECLVEVHDEAELNVALEAGAKLIGVNSRNLKMMKVDLKTAERLAKQIPEGIIKIAESGIHSIDDAKRMKDCGYKGVLVGEFLVKASDPSKLIKEMRGL